MNRVLLIEDEPNVVSFIRRGLEENGYQVQVAYDGETGLRLATQEAFDVIVLDVILPHRNGLEVCRQLRARCVTTPIIMLTALGTTDDKVLGLDTGADDYLTKPFKFQELLARLRALGRRHQRLPTAEVLRVSNLVLNLDTREVWRGDQPIVLTAREFRLLEYLMRHRGRVLTRAQILEGVWEVDYDPGSNVVEVYVNYLRNKVDRGFEPKLIQTVIGMGYVLKEKL